jgi:hypothetical protein
MPCLIEVETSEQAELGDLVDALESSAFDPRDEDSLASFGPALKRLSNNRRFLGDLMIEELKQRCAGQMARNRYSAQVILLHGESGKFLVRANVWPAEADSVVVNSGSEPFFYHVPHDHNFSFLTVGHVGPGYWSDYYEYDYEKAEGYIGERVDLRFVERSRLSPGKVLLYRRHRDVHNQLPPDSLSVSLNILAFTPAIDFLDQYSFDLESSTISGAVNRNTLETLVLLVGRLGGENGRDLIDFVATRHPSERLRFAGWRARASALAAPEERAALYDEAARSAAGGFVRAMAEREAARIRASRAFYERPPIPFPAPAP